MLRNGDRRLHSHAVEHDVREIAQNQAKGERGRGQEGRPVESRRQLASEVGIPYRIRHHGVDRTSDRLIFKAPENHASDITHMNAAHPLMAISQFATEA